MISTTKAHDLCVAFRKLGNGEFQVFEYIYNLKLPSGHYPKYYYIGNYTHLSKEIGLNPGNTRKAVLKLVELGVVKLSIDEKTRAKVILIDINWEDNLINNSKDRPNPHEGIKRPRKNKKETKHEI